MSIALLKTFIAVAEGGSFSAAAAKVCVSQAAVGQQMRRLEAQFDVVLFDRGQKTPQLNQLGKSLVPKAVKLVRSYETIFDDLTGDARLIGELNLGAVPSAVQGLIPLSIKRLVAECPDLHIRVHPELSGELLVLVERGGIDAAVLSEPSRIAKNLRWRPFVEEPLVLLTSPEVTENDPFKILKEMPYIQHTRRAAVGLLVEDWLESKNIEVHDCIQTTSLETISSMVSHNLGVSVVPDICVPDPVFSSLRKISLGSDVASRTLGILTRADCSKVLLMDRLLEKINETLRAHRSAFPK